MYSPIHYSGLTKLLLASGKMPAAQKSKVEVEQGCAEHSVFSRGTAECISRAVAEIALPYLDTSFTLVDASTSNVPLHLPKVKKTSSCTCSSKPRSD